MFSRLQSNLYKWLHYAPAIGAVWALVTGVLVLAGWHFRSAVLVQLLPKLPAMQYNTAVCFTLLGLGFGLLLLGQRRLSAFCCLGVIGLGGLGLSQDIIGWNLGVDTLWIEPFITVGAVHPGRMAPVTAICHMSAAGALLLAGFSQRMRVLGGCFLIAIALCSLGVSITFGYVANLPTTFWWGHANKIALHSAVALVVCGIGIAVYAWQRAKHFGHRMFFWGILSLNVALLIQTVGFWQSMTVLRQSDIERVLRQQGESVKDAIIDDLRGRTGHLERMAERWRVRGGTPRDEWGADALNFVKGLQGSLALLWVNRDGKVEWAVPPAGEAKLVGKKYTLSKTKQKAWKRAVERQAAVTSQLSPLVLGGEGFLSIVPVYRQNVPDGAIIAVYRLEEWLNTILLEKKTFSGYEIAVLRKGELVSQWPSQAKRPDDSRWMRVYDIQFDDLKLSVQVWPGATLQRSMSSALPEIVLLVGIVLSTLLTWSVSLLRDVREQSRALSAANSRLTEQMRILRETKRSLQSSTRFQHAILEGASYPIFSVGVDKIVTSFNKAAASAFGYSPEEVIGKTTPEIFHDREEYAQFRQALDEMEPVTGGEGERDIAGREGPLQKEFSFVRKDGSRFPGKLSVSTLRDETGTLTGCVAIIYDLTQAKRAEEAIRISRDAAEQANQAKSAFLANMSHEVRTPLNAIIGINQMLLESTLQPEQRLWVRTLQDSAESLLTIVNDILDFSKVEAGQISVESIEFGLAKTIEQVARLHGVKASEKGVLLKTEIKEGTPNHLLGDPTRLSQVLNNLVSNAIKFTERGSIHVSAELSRMDGNEACIRFDVLDSGIGMDEQTCSRIFDPFAQADASTTRRFGGTGLGLTICRFLIERMGGKIRLESEPGKGSRFWFELRFQVIERSSQTAQGRLAEEKTPGGQFDWRKVSVLLVDDSATNRLVAKHQLHKLGCRVELAQNGREALALLANGIFDVVLMDGQMPEMDGYEATIELRRREEGSARRTRVVAMTANAMPGEREHCLEVGMDHYLSKPFKAHQLEAVLLEVLLKPATVAVSSTPVGA